MGEIYKFNTFEALDNYIRAITNEPMYYGSDPTLQYQLWKEQYNAVYANQVRSIPHYGKGGSIENYTWEFETFDSDIITPASSNIAVESSTSNAIASTATETISNAVGGGGVKKAPTVTKVITDSTTGEATVGETAKGFKDVGVATKVPVHNLLTGIMAAYGLYSLAITVSNWHTWEDVFNSVFPGALPQDATFDDVVEFAKGRYQFYIGGLIDSYDIHTYVPETIVQRMYDFLAPHMEADGSIEGLIFELSDVFPGNQAWRRFYDTSRLFEYYPGPIPTPGSSETYFSHLYFRENLLRNWMIDALDQMVGLGFSISQSTTNILLNATNSLTEYIIQHAGASVLTRKLCKGTIELYRDAHTPKSQPISPSEVSIQFYLINDYKMEIDVDTGVTVDFIPAGTQQNPNYSKFLKYGHSGEDIYDYGYWFKSQYGYNEQLDEYWLTLSFPSNEMEITDNGDNPSMYDGNVLYYVNGFCTDGVLDTDEYPPADPAFDQWFDFDYCNLGYKGEGRNYKPDSYLSEIVGKDDVGGTKLRPTATGDGYLAWDDRYKQWAARQQKRGTVTKTGQNTIVKDVPVYVPFGNTDQIIEHGYNNPNDTDSYQNNSDQNERQRGAVPTDTPIEHINDAIQDVVDDYNDSRYTPDSMPDPVPASEPMPDFPETPPTDPEGDSGDTPDPGLMPGVTASGMVSVYNPTKAEIINFSGWLWSTSVMENLKRLLADPMDAIIGLHIMYATPITGAPENIIAGYLDSQIPAKVVTKQFIEISCGSVVVPEFYGNVFDYEPYTQIHMYLPFVGIVAIKANDVVGKKVSVKYGIDVLTGTCLAMVNTEKGESNIQCYQFAGNCAVQIPLTGGNYAGIIRSLASMTVGVAGSVLSGNPLPAIGGVIGGAMGASLDVSHSGSLGANAGVLGIRKPYIIITRRIAYEAQGYNQFYGFPANLTVTLGNCKGYTRVKSVHIDSISKATDTEKTEIETLLRQGVIIK